MAGNGEMCGSVPLGLPCFEANRTNIGAHTSNAASKCTFWLYHAAFILLPSPLLPRLIPDPPPVRPPAEVVSTGLLAELPPCTTPALQFTSESRSTTNVHPTI